MSDDDDRMGEDSPEVAQLMDLAEDGDAEGFLAHLTAVPSLSVAVRNDEGETALHLGCLYGSTEIARICLERGADVNALDEDASTPLCNASAGGFTELVRQLLAAGADLLAADSDGDTPLHHACNGNHADAARLLASAGASTTATNRSGRTAAALTDDEVVRAAVADGAAEYAANPPAALAARRMVKARRPDGGGGAGVGSPGSDMPPPPPRQPLPPSLSTIGRRPSCSDMVPAASSAPQTLADFALPPHVLQGVLADPELVHALANPQLLSAMREVLEEPTRLDSVCAQSPELAQFLARVVALGGQPAPSQ